MNRKSVFSKAALAVMLVGMLGLCLVFTACPPIDTTLPALTGKPTISGTPKVGEILTANQGTLNGTGTPSYQWEVNSNVAGTNQNTYVPVAGDVGATITVTVSYSGNTGSQTSDATDEVADLSGASTATVNLWTDDTTVFASTPSVTLSRATFQTALFTGLSGAEYTNHQWSINGSDVAGPPGTASTFSFSSNGNGNGKYHIGLQVQKGSAWYSTTIIIEVTN
ncbi:hypothetical protein FACS1894163_11270 [Spirochaetia bacterium]|nr:hypothetical protein FACS1894163_11270 [Spirochaetia bacterium]